MLRRDVDSGGVDFVSSSSEEDLEEEEGEGGVGEPASRGKLMLPGMRWSSGTVGDGRTRGILMTLFLRRERRDCDRFRAVGGLRTAGVAPGPAGGGASVSATALLDGGNGTSSTLGVDDWTGETPAVGDAFARGIDGVRRGRR